MLPSNLLTVFTMLLVPIDAEKKKQVLCVTRVGCDVNMHKVVKLVHCIICIHVVFAAV